MIMVTRFLLNYYLLQSTARALHILDDYCKMSFNLEWVENFQELLFFPFSCVNDGVLLQCKLIIGRLS